MLKNETEASNAYFTNNHKGDVGKVTLCRLLFAQEDWAELTGCRKQAFK